MSFTLVVTEKRDYLLLIGSGSLQNEEEYLDWCMTSVQKARERGHTLLLFDNRTLLLELTKDEIFNVANRLVEMGAHEFGFRVAVISNRQTIDLARYVETTFIHRSLMYKSFDSQEEALDWLLA